MAELDTRSFQEMAELTAVSGERKAALPLPVMLVLALLGGAFIALAGQASNIAAFGLLAHPESFGLGKCVAGLLFPIGLMMVVIAGAELFTGNTLMVTALAQKRISAAAMLRNWLVVYCGNFAGSLAIAGMIVASGQLEGGGGMLGAVTLKIAAGKTTLAFWPAFWLGVLCNWLVCLAVWMASGARGTAGKLLAIFFPVWLFVTSGFEHCIANMYYVPAGILSKGNELFVRLSGLSQTSLDGLNWQNFLVGNLVPVTLGNIVGGSLFVGMVYWYAYGRKRG